MSFTRRGFMSSETAQTTETKGVSEIDRMLRRYCSTDSGTKYGMQLPFVKGGWKYATDGRVCVRVRCDEPDTDPSDGPFPPCDNLFSRNTSSLAIAPWPAPEYEIEYIQVSCGKESCDESQISLEFVPDGMPLGSQFIGSIFHYKVSRLPNVHYRNAFGTLDPIFF